MSLRADGDKGTTILGNCRVCGREILPTDKEAVILEGVYWRCGICVTIIEEELNDRK